jgi:hypothetical protein
MYLEIYCDQGNNSDKYMDYFMTVYQLQRLLVSRCEDGHGFLKILLHNLPMWKMKKKSQNTWYPR